jgi:short-subunit dehydrogenase
MTDSANGRGQTALVTGASMGIGVDLAECFARDGYDLVLAARSADALQNVAATLSARHNVRVTPIVADLGARGSGERLAADIAARDITIDVVVNNAGYGVAAGFADADLAGQLGMIDLNIRALVELTHIYWPRMLANRRGGVLNVASTAAFQPGPLMAVYYASKAFVLSFSEALWKEADGTGVHVSCLCPGPTASHFRERAGTGKTQLAKSLAVMPSADVAAMGYQAWKDNRRVIVTGTRNAMMASLVRFMPKKAVLDSVYRMQSPPSN